MRGRRPLEGKSFLELLGVERPGFKFQLGLFQTVALGKLLNLQIFVNNMGIIVLTLLGCDD